MNEGTPLMNDRASFRTSGGGRTAPGQRFRMRLPACLLAAGLCLVRLVMVSAAGPIAPEATGVTATSDSHVWSALRFVPRATYFLAGVRPRDLMQVTALDDIDSLLAALTEYGLGRRIDVAMSDVTQFVVVGTYGGPRLASYNAMAIVELQSREAALAMMAALFGSAFDPASERVGTGNTVALVRELAGVLSGERTVLLGPPSVIQNWKFSGDAGAVAEAEVPWPVRFTDALSTQAFAVLDLEQLRRFAPRFDDWMLSEYGWLAAASPLLRETRRLEIAVQGRNGLQLTTTVSGNQESLADIDGTLRAATTIVRNVLRESLKAFPEWSHDAAVPFIRLTRDALARPVLTSDGGLSRVQMKLQVSRDQLREFRAAVAPLAGRLELSARRSLRSRNLKRIGDAMLAYYRQHGSFPPAAVSRDGNVRFSWRVALLPFLGEHQLYEKYHLDEPWSSSANQEVLRQMPDVYRHVDDSPTSYRSAYYALTGPGTAFGDGDQVIHLRDFRDGVSNTILVVESRQGVPWTKPSDIEVRPDAEVPSFGGFDPAGALVLLGDTAVTFMPASVAPASLRAFITRAGGERISLP